MSSLAALEQYCLANHPALRVRMHEHRGGPWVELAVVLGETAAYHRYTLLLHNFDLVIGQIIERDSKVLIMQSMPIEHTTNEHLEKIAADLVAQAERTRQFFRHPK